MPISEAILQAACPHAASKTFVEALVSGRLNGWTSSKVKKRRNSRTGVACPAGVDDFEYFSGAHKIQESLHGRSRIQETHTAIPGAGISPI
jgi:hypothetical protein